MNRPTIIKSDTLLTFDIPDQDNDVFVYGCFEEPWEELKKYNNVETRIANKRDVSEIPVFLNYQTDLLIGYVNCLEFNSRPIGANFYELEHRLNLDIEAEIYTDIPELPNYKIEKMQLSPGFIITKFRFDGGIRYIEKAELVSIGLTDTPESLLMGINLDKQLNFRTDYAKANTTH